MPGVARVCMGNDTTREARRKGFGRWLSRGRLVTELGGERETEAALSR